MFSGNLFSCPTVRLLSRDAIVHQETFLGLSHWNIPQELVDCTQTKNLLAFNEYCFLLLLLQLLYTESSTDVLHYTTLQAEKRSTNDL